MKRSLRSWLWRVSVEQEVEEELALHIELRTRELMARGVDPSEARQQALRRMGDLREVRRELVELGRRRDREMNLTRWMNEFREDVRFALRQLRAAPLFTLVAVATLALGLGANTAIFALVDAALLRPLPFGEPERLVALFETSSRTGRGSVSPLNMLDWKARGTSLDAVAGYVQNIGGMVMEGKDGQAETAARQWVTSEIFNVLGVRPLAGRVFDAADDKAGRNVVVLAESFWRKRFDADLRVIGREIRLDGDLFTVVGVAPGSFQLIGPSDMWAMRSLEGLPPRARGSRALGVVGRLKGGVSRASAEAELKNLAAALATEFPATNTGRGVAVLPLRDAVVGADLRTTSFVFLGVVGLVLLLCCANVANLLLARASARTRELAVRAALGAGRGRIMRQMMTESVVLSAIGGIAGLAVGAAIVSAAPSLIPIGVLPGLVTLEFDLRLVFFCSAATLLVGVLFGVAPAFQATNFSASEAMGADPRTTASPGGKTRAFLVTSEVATAVLLLFSSGLLLRSFLAVDTFDRGYRAESVLSLMVDPLSSQFETPEALQGFFDQVETEVRAVPGVRDMGWTTDLPLGGFGGAGLVYEIVGDPPVEEGVRPTTQFQAASPSYFTTLDLPVVTGRAFDATDTRTSPPVALVNEAFARSIGSRSPIGLRVALKSASNPTAPPTVREIVGVVRQVKGRPDEERDFVQIYAPFAQALDDDAYLVVSPASGDASALAKSVRGAISKVDRQQLVSVREIQTLRDIDWAATGRHRFRAVLVGAFAALALLLAMVGVFGILAYSVQQRIRDLGVRRALGASTRDIVKEVVVGAARLVGAGSFVGLVAAALLSRGLSSLLFGVQPLDLATAAAVIVMVVIAGGGSVAVPAFRAARIDPAAALRTK